MVLPRVVLTVWDGAIGVINTRNVDIIRKIAKKVEK